MNAWLSLALLDFRSVNVTMTNIHVTSVPYQCKTMLFLHFPPSLLDL